MAIHIQNTEISLKHTLIICYNLATYMHIASYVVLYRRSRVALLKCRSPKSYLHKMGSQNNCLSYSNNYRICRIIGGEFNLAVWQIIFNPPNLNNAISGL